MNTRRDPVIDAQQKDHLSVVEPLRDPLPMPPVVSREVEVVALNIPLRQLLGFSIKLAIALLPLLVIVGGAWALIEGAMPIVQEAVFGPTLVQE